MPDHLLLTGIIWFQQSFRFSSSLFLPQTELRGSCICNVVLNFVLEEMPRRECAFGWGSAGSTGIELLWYSLFPPGQKFDLVCTCHFGLLSVKVNTLTANIGSSFAFLFCCHVRHSESPTWVPRPVTSERVPPIDEGSGSSRWCVCDIRLGCHSIFALGVKFWWRFDFGLTGFQQIVWCVLIWIQIQWTVRPLDFILQNLQDLNAISESTNDPKLWAKKKTMVRASKLSDWGYWPFGRKNRACQKTLCFCHLLQTFPGTNAYQILKF
jgi:hypothetical protein